MLILDEFVQVDKSDAEISVTYFYVNLFVVVLCCQIETETGTAGEQPVRDMFDLHDVAFRIACFGSPFYYRTTLVALCLKKPINKFHFTFFR
jgi:hypothetical protein